MPHGVRDGLLWLSCGAPGGDLRGAHQAGAKAEADLYLSGFLR